MFSSTSTAGSLTSTGSGAPPEAAAFDYPAIRLLNADLERVLATSNMVLRSAGEALQSRQGTRQGQPDTEERIERIFTATRRLTRPIKEDLDRKVDTPHPILLNAIDTVMAKCRDETLVPTVEEIAERQDEREFRDQLTLVHFHACADLSNALAAELDAIPPAIQDDVRGHLAQVVEVLYDSGEFEALIGARSAEALLTFLEPYPHLHAALARYLDYQPVDRDQLMAIVREPLDQLRADRMIAGGMDKAVVAAISARAVVPADEPAIATSWRKPRDLAQTVQRRWVRRVKLLIARLRHRSRLAPEAAIRKALLRYQKVTATAMDDLLHRTPPPVYAHLASAIWDFQRRWLEDGEAELQQLYRRHAADLWGTDNADAESAEQVLLVRFREAVAVLQQT